MAEATSGLDPVSVFALLGHETRLDILRTLYDETRGSGAGRGAVTYTTLRETVGEPDSGKFNYHLSKLTDHFVEKLRDGYALRGPGEEVIRVLRSGELTRTPTFDPVGTDASCPRCDGGVDLSYANNHVFAHCTDCAGLLEFDYVPAGTLLAVPFPPAGATDRDPASLLPTATLGYEHRLQMMADGLCPECGGAVASSFLECPDHSGSVASLCGRCHTAFDALTVLTCETCDRCRVAPPAFTCTHRDPVADALTAAGTGNAWERYAEVARWPVWLRGTGDEREVVYAPPDEARIVVFPDLSIVRTSPLPTG